MKIWGWILGGVLVFGIGLFVWQIVRPMPDMGTAGHSMEPPDTGSISAGDPIVEVVLPKDLSGNATIGKQIFEAKCAACHGLNAVGQNGIAPPLVHKIYEPNHHSDGAFQAAVSNGVRSHHWRFGDMPKIDGLTRADVKMIASYVRELQRENGIN